MLKLSTAVAAIALLALSACAPRAASIPPVAMGNAYASLTCQQAAAMLNAERRNVQTLTSAQNAAATTDAIGVFLVLVPLGNLTGGNKAGELGEAKGKVLALEQRLMTCDVRTVAG